MEAEPPTLQQFKETCRSEFAFLLRDHGFVETVPPPSAHRNPFEIYYERSGWLIVISGVSHGFGASLIIRDPRNKTAGLWHLVPSEFFRTHREGLGRGQLGDIRYCALTLRVFGNRFLTGDTSLFDELLRKHEEYLEQDRQEVESRPYQRAARDASEAFKNQNYREMVRLLSPFVERLSEIERRKFDYAQRHIT